MDGKEPAITWTDKGVTLGVVVASNGYPLAYEKGVKLPAKTEGDIITYYAGAKLAENGQDLFQTEAVSTCWSQQQTPSKTDKILSTANSTNKIQKASSTEPISEARR